MTDYAQRLLSATREQLIDEVLRLRGDLARVERERDELRAAVFELCGMQLRITEQREAIAAYRKAANDASQPFSIRRVEALLGTELCDCGEPITHAGACSYGGR